MAKWDIKDGFWRLDCREGEEYNFAYVLPQPEDQPTILVIPTSLQMGWIKSPGFFCAASETSRDVANMYCQTRLGSLPLHKFDHYMRGSECFKQLPKTDDQTTGQYLIEVFVDDFMSLVIATAQDQCLHVGTATMMGVHDVFPESDVINQDPISEKKLEKCEAQFDMTKTLLGFDLDGEAKTLWLTKEKRAALLLILKGWIRTSVRTNTGIPFQHFESVIAKLRHAFTAIPAGAGLLSPCNKILALRPKTVFLQQNEDLQTAIQDIRVLLRESIAAPTRCKELVCTWPHIIGYTDASRHGFGGVIVGETTAIPPTVFRGAWPPDIKNELVLVHNPSGSISISDLEMTGFLILWFVIEATAPTLLEQSFALFSDNSPSISWATRLASRRSLIGARLIRALALRMKLNKCCPITPLHVAGKQNIMADVASRSYGSNPKWHCNSDRDFQLMFNSLFPLPSQNTWSVFRLNTALCMKVILLRWKSGVAFQKLVNTLEKLVLLYATSGSGPVLATLRLHRTYTSPLRICCSMPNRTLWKKATN